MAQASRNNTGPRRQALMPLCAALLLLSACENPLWGTRGGGNGNGASPAENGAPVASGTLSTTAILGETVSLDLTASDPEQDPLNFEWSFASVPDGSTLTDEDIAERTTLDAAFIPDLPGTYEAVLTLSDGTNSVSVTVTIAVTTGPPGAPVVEWPLDGAEEVAVTVQLQWSAAYASQFDLYFSATDPPALFAEDLTDVTLDPSAQGILEYSTTYYWMVIAENDEGTAEGVLWSFTTEPEPLDPPDAPSAPLPANGAPGIPVDTRLTWNAPGGSSFNLRFDTTSPPSVLTGGITSTSYDPSPEGSLEYETTYYWRIEAVNSAGSVNGAVWSFTTEDAPVPETPALTVPADGCAWRTQLLRPAAVGLRERSRV